MGNDGIVHEHEGHLLRIYLDRPDRRNALTSGALRTLGDVLRDEGQRSSVRCVAIASTTPGTFCSGFDISASSVGDIFAGEAMESARHAFGAFEDLAVPTIALVDGPAHGGGCELALRCDLRVGTDRSSFAVPAARYGLPYLPESVAYLTDLLGRSVARWLLIAGERLDAESALVHGLLHEVVNVAELEARGDALVRRIVAGAPLVHTYLKEAIGREASSDPAGREQVTKAALEEVRRSADLREAQAALSEGRDPRFRGA